MCLRQKKSKSSVSVRERYVLGGLRVRVRLLEVSREEFTMPGAVVEGERMLAVEWGGKSSGRVTGKSPLPFWGHSWGSQLLGSGAVLCT
jgi:hypothetical protein